MRVRRRLRFRSQWFWWSYSVAPDLAPPQRLPASQRRRWPQTVVDLQPELCSALWCDKSDFSGPEVRGDCRTCLSHALDNRYHWKQTGSLRFSLRLRAVCVTAPPCFTEWAVLFGHPESLPRAIMIELYMVIFQGKHWFSSTSCITVQAVICITLQSLFVVSPHTDWSRHWVGASRPPPAAASTLVRQSPPIIISGSYFLVASTWSSSS